MLMRSSLTAINPTEVQRTGISRRRSLAGSHDLHILIHVRELFPTHRDWDMDYSGTMRDRFALSRLLLALTASVRLLFLATSAIIGVSATYVLYILIRRRIAAYRSLLRNIPGPAGGHWFKGNFTEVEEADSTRLQEEWVQKYGHVLKFQSTLWVRFSSYFLNLIIIFLIHSFGPLQNQKLLAVDPVAISYVLQNNDSFQKSELLRSHLGSFTGRGMHDRAMAVHFGVLF